MKKSLLAAILAATCLSTPALAEIDHSHHNHHSSPGLSISGSGGHNHGIRSHAPISIMGDHMHEKGDWMFSYRFMRMEMKDNRDGTDGLSPDEISGDVANRFFGVPGQPSTLRIVPTEMTMDMHMLGAMYAPSDWLTLMVMANYLDNEMDHITFSGADPDLELGRFTTETSGWGDARVSGLIRLFENENHHVHLNAGLSLPTGSIDETGEILSPMNTRVTLRLPYAMQLGSGTFDLLPGVTYIGASGKYGWGAQYNGEIRLGENDEDYTLGNQHRIDAWVGYQWLDNLSGSLRVGLESEQKIDGIDSQIVGPVQTADPDNYGGRRVDVGLGLNYTLDFQSQQDHSISAEFTLPVYQDLNGPQLERDYGFVVGYRIGF